MLIFVAPDTGGWESVERETRRYLAWDSIVQEVDALNLDANQRREASQGKEQSNDTVAIRLNEAYSWLLVPTQEGTDPIVWEATRISGSDDNPVGKSRCESPKRPAAHHKMVACFVKDGTGQLALERGKPY